MNSSPSGGAQECWIVLCTQKDLQEQRDLFAKHTERCGEGRVFGLHVAGFDEANVVFDHRWIFIVVQVWLEFPANAHFVEVLVRQLANYVFQQVYDMLLLLQEILVSCANKRGIIIFVLGI